jgi:peptidoglycan/xylan/chitin deacetylase (PgdA/CDA1 family)
VKTNLASKLVGNATLLAILFLSATTSVVMIALWTAPRWLVPRLADRFPGCLYTVATTARAIALTIDDGPDASTTPQLLRTLREHNARATFFLISGNVMQNDSLIAAIVNEGHEIGNHLTRDEPSIGLSARAFDSALTTAGRTLSRFGSVRWARPGGGRYDQRMVTTMQQRGYRCALGSVYPYDAEIPSARFSSAFVLAHARPGAIVVLHDGGTRGRRTATTLRRVLPELRRRGFDVVALSELAASRGS